MKLSVAALSLVAGSAVYAQGPHTVRANLAANSSTSKVCGSNPYPGANKPGQSAGAAYFMNNQPEGNFLISCDVGTDGKLTYRNAVSTGGKGGHGTQASLGPDALFSVNSVKVSGQQVFVVNAGSNSLSMFSIDKNDPGKITLVGNPVDTGGEFPISVAVSDQTGQVCVLNGGKMNGVNCFNQDHRRGLLRIANTNRVTNVNQTTPPSGPGGSLSDLVFSEDGSQLMALGKGAPGMAPGTLRLWDIDARTGALSENFTPMHGGILPFSMTFIPGKNALISTDPGVGFDIWDFENPKNASVKSFPIEGQKETCWSQYSPKTGNFYFSDLGVGRITEVHVDGNLNGTLVKHYPQGNGSAPADNSIATIEKKDYLYTLAAGATSVVVLSLDAPGMTTHVQDFNITEATMKSGIKIDRNNLQGMGVYVKGN